jgi:hypothetical protein
MPKRGTKYLTPLARKGPKTGRVYARMVSVVRQMKGPFTCLDLPFPRYYSRVMLQGLYRKGELLRVAPASGRGGRGVKPCVYIRACEHEEKISSSTPARVAADKLDSHGEFQGQPVAVTEG